MSNGLIRGVSPDYDCTEGTVPVVTETPITATTPIANNQSKPAAAAASSSSPATKSVCDLPASEKERVRKRLSRFYEKHAADRMDAVDRAMAMSLSECSVLEKICGKYNVNSKEEEDDARERGLLPVAPGKVDDDDEGEFGELWGEASKLEAPILSAVDPAAPPTPLHALFLTLHNSLLGIDNTSKINTKNGNDDDDNNGSKSNTNAAPTPGTSGVALSLLNISTCIAMLADFLTGPTCEELFRLFGFVSPVTENKSELGFFARVFGPPYSCLPPSTLAIMKEYAGSSPSSKVSVTFAHALLYTNDGTIRGDYVSHVKGAPYLAQVKVLGSNPAAASKAIKEVNEYVKKATSGMITEFVPAELAHQQQRSPVVLVSALCFKGKWLQPFKRNQTEADYPFHASADRTVPCVMMSRNKVIMQMAMVGPGVCLAAIPYVGGDVFFVVEFTTGEKDYRLPTTPSEPSVLVSLAQGKAGQKMEDIKLWMPKFRVETSVSPPELRAAMSSCGASSLFSPREHADDYKKVYENQGRVPESIDIAHTVVVEVDEDGTVAAAATRVMVCFCIEAPPPRVNLDRPFYFSIVSAKHSVVLFRGSVLEPKWEGDVSYARRRDPETGLYLPAPGSGFCD